ncbi:MAG: hypothetical protein JO197_07365 [Acidobacteria bacterium]|nr:hypothetical protein [Acidobacteriota bacterium]MBV9475791.1 hypothetical protein [Acidobacteriota bacterium]
MTCPHANAAPSATTDDLYTASQVERLLDPSHPLAQTLAWVRRFLAKPNQELGRPGAVCPFVPGALAQDTIWLTLAPHTQAQRNEIVATVARFRDRFLTLDPKDGEDSMSKAILIVFPYLTSADAGLIDDVQLDLKPSFVEHGMMLGEFHERNESPGLRNPQFRPLRSPIPMLAIRYMVDSDLPFLHRSIYNPALRADFIRSYLRRLGTRVSRNTFDAAVSALVAAEIEQLDAVKIVELIMTR